MYLHIRVHLYVLVYIFAHVRVFTYSCAYICTCIQICLCGSVRETCLCVPATMCFGMFYLYLRPVCVL